MTAPWGECAMCERTELLHTYKRRRLPSVLLCAKCGASKSVQRELDDADDEADDDAPWSEDGAGA